MLRRFTIGLALSVVLMAVTPPGPAAGKNQTFEQLAHEILETLQSFYPVRATEMGIHSYDHRLADYSSSSVKSMIKKLNDYEQQLYRFRNTRFTPAQQVDYKLIKSNVDIALQDLKQIEWHKKSPQLYVGEAVNGVYFLMLSQHAPLSEKLYSILSRMEAVPGLFSTARKNVKAPPRVWVDAATTALESGMEFYRQVASQLMSAFPDRADEISRVSTKAREAMNDYLEFVSRLEAGSGTAFAIGKGNFDYKLSHEYFLTIDSDSLLRVGEALLDEAKRAYDEYEMYVEQYHQNGQDSVFVPASFTRQDVLDYYQWETNQIKLFVQMTDLLNVPEDIADVSVVETPPFMRSMIPGIAYLPAGPFDTSQQGYFYIRPVPEALDRKQLEALYRYVHRRGFKGSVVHEAFPGHHLQMQIAGRHESEVRRWQRNYMMIEGWALYCEEMMYNAGLYGDEDPAQWLAILGGIVFRAARIVADVKLHTEQFTYQECVDWMTDVLEAETESEKEYIRTSIRKYTLTPTIWMSYLMGKTEIERLRAAAEANDPGSFDERDFYDALLAEGSIPPAMMWEIMNLEPVP
ncbi:MAG TPA: DUF885 domain-containing protein [Acidobacteriota bacterium]|nr:DUF885 domain-containing protein [Acidobacteriota bacterium]